eukprot:3443025-Rhodomonas_salina.1
MSDFSVRDVVRRILGLKNDHRASTGGLFAPISPFYFMKRADCTVNRYTLSSNAHSRRYAQREKRLSCAGFPWVGEVLTLCWSCGCTKWTLICASPSSRTSRCPSEIPRNRWPTLSALWSTNGRLPFPTCRTRGVAALSARHERVQKEEEREGGSGKTREREGAERAREEGEWSEKGGERREES